MNHSTVTIVVASHVLIDVLLFLPGNDMRVASVSFYDVSHLQQPPFLSWRLSDERWSAVVLGLILIMGVCTTAMILLYLLFWNHDMASKPFVEIPLLRNLFDQPSDDPDLSRKVELLHDAVDHSKNDQDHHQGDDDVSDALIQVPPRPRIAWAE